MSSVWQKFLRPQFVVLVVFLALLIVAYNTGLKLPPEIVAAITAAVVAWIGGETWVDTQRVMIARDDEDEV